MVEADSCTPRFKTRVSIFVAFSPLRPGEEGGTMPRVGCCSVPARSVGTLMESCPQAGDDSTGSPVTPSRFPGSNPRSSIWQSCRTFCHAGGCMLATASACFGAGSER